MASNDFYGASLGQNIPSPQTQHTQIQAAGHEVTPLPQHSLTAQPLQQHEELPQTYTGASEPPKAAWGDHPQHLTETVQPPNYSQAPTPVPQAQHQYIQQNPALQQQYYAEPQKQNIPATEHQQKLYGQGPPQPIPMTGYPQKPHGQGQHPAQQVVVVNQQKSKEDAGLGFCVGCLAGVCCCGCTVM